MSDAEVTFKICFLPFRGSGEPETVELRLQPLRQSAGTIIDKMSVSGFVIHGGTIIEEGDLIKNFYNDSSPIVVAECGKGYQEPAESSKRTNQLARLLLADIPLSTAFQALGRAPWHEGFSVFSVVAMECKKLVDCVNTFDYQRRTDICTVTLQWKELSPVGVFNEVSPRQPPPLMLPPILRADMTGGHILGDWVDRPKVQISSDVLSQVQAEAQRIGEAVPVIETAAQAVVRVFGYHALDVNAPIKGQRLLPVPFTAFFVAPKLLLTSRSAKYNTATDTFAFRFAFTRATRAIHGMLTEGENLFECHEVPGVTEYLTDAIRRLGIVVLDSKIPAGQGACSWNDLMLLEIADDKQASDVFLLPETDAVEKGDPVATVQFPTKPSEDWMEDTFGGRGFNLDLPEETLRNQFWQYDVKACTFGSATSQLEDGGNIHHSASMLPGSRGAPVLRRFGTVGMPTFVGVSIGRCVETLNAERDHVESMSTGELARVEGLASQMYNEAMSVTHVSFVLLYQKYVAPLLNTDPYGRYAKSFLAPYRILVQDDVLSACHRKMLKDADDHNEYGMDFYDHSDVVNALACFREGARMFSIASIPNLTEFEVELKDALQTNVSAVVVSKLDSNKR